jgi:hypothetical protein
VFPKNIRLHPLNFSNVQGDRFIDLGRVTVGQGKPELRKIDQDTSLYWVGSGQSRASASRGFSPCMAKGHKQKFTRAGA